MDLANRRPLQWRAAIRRLQAASRRHEKLMKSCLVGQVRA